MILPIFTFWHKVAAIAALAVLAGIFGAWGGHKITKAHYVAKEIARVEAEQKEYARLSKIAADLGQALAAETRKRQEDARAHRAEIQEWRKHGTIQVECPTDGLKAISPDAVRFDAGFVDLWNAGLYLGLSPPAAPKRSDAAPKRADPPTATELLTNSADNAEACNGDRARLKALQQYVRELAKEK